MTRLDRELMLTIPNDVMHAERVLSDWMEAQGHRTWALGRSRNRFDESEQHEVRTSSDGAAAVDPDYYWRDMATCPRGVKVQLLAMYGVALYGSYDGRDTQWRGWAPLPKVRKP